MHLHVFELLQDNCEERELRFRALCEQVSLRISSIDDTPVPAAAKQQGSTRNPEVPHGEGVVTDTAAEAPTVMPDAVANAEISHLIFDPTILTR